MMMVQQVTMKNKRMQGLMHGLVQRHEQQNFNDDGDIHAQWYRLHNALLLSHDVQWSNICWLRPLISACIRNPRSRCVDVLLYTIQRWPAMTLLDVLLAAMSSAQRYRHHLVHIYQCTLLNVVRTCIPNTCIAFWYLLGSDWVIDKRSKVMVHKEEDPHWVH